MFNQGKIGGVWKGEGGFLEIDVVKGTLIPTRLLLSVNG